MRVARIGDQVLKVDVPGVWRQSRHCFLQTRLAVIITHMITTPWSICIKRCVFCYQLFLYITFEKITSLHCENVYNTELLTCHWAPPFQLPGGRWTAGRVCWNNAAVHGSDELPLLPEPPGSQSHRGYKCATGDSADPKPRYRLCCCLQNRVKTARKRNWYSTEKTTAVKMC